MVNYKDIIIRCQDLTVIYPLHPNDLFQILQSENNRKKEGERSQNDEDVS